MNDQALKVLLFKTVNHALTDFRDATEYGEMTEEAIAARYTYNTLYNFLIDSGLENEYLEWKYQGGFVK